MARGVFLVDATRKWRLEPISVFDLDTANEEGNSRFFEHSLYLIPDCRQRATAAFLKVLKGRQTDARALR